MLARQMDRSERPDFAQQHADARRIQRPISAAKHPLRYKSTSVVYGMPRAAWENGAAQKQVSLDRAAELIIRHHEAPVSRGVPVASFS